MSESNADYYGGSPGAPTLEHDPFHKELAKTDTKQDRATKPSVNVGGTALGTGSPKGRGYDTNDQNLGVLLNEVLSIQSALELLGSCNLEVPSGFLNTLNQVFWGLDRLSLGLEKTEKNWKVIEMKLKQLEGERDFLTGSLMDMQEGYKVFGTELKRLRDRIDKNRSA